MHIIYTRLFLNFKVKHIFKLMDLPGFNLDVPVVLIDGKNVHITQQGISKNSKHYFTDKGDKIELKDIREEFKKPLKEAVKKETARVALVDKYKKQAEDKEKDVIEKLKTRERFNIALPQLKSDGYRVFNRDYGIFGNIYKPNEPVIMPTLVHLFVEEFKKIKQNIKDDIQVQFIYSMLHEVDGRPVEYDEAFRTFKINKDDVNFANVYANIGIHMEKYTGSKDRQNPIMDGNGVFYPTDKVEIVVREWRLPEGEGITEDLKQTVMHPKTLDIIDVPTGCGAYALILGMSMNNANMRKALLKRDTKHRNKFDEKAKELITKLGLPAKGSMIMGFQDFDTFTSLHPEYVVKILQSVNSEIQITYRTAELKPRGQFTNIYILLYKEHYFHVNNINGFMVKSNNYVYCQYCDKSILKKVNHACVFPRCKVCKCVFDVENDLREHQAQPTDGHCDSCNSNFYRGQCLAYHKTICKGGYYCATCCKKNTHSKENHICGQEYCHNCDANYFLRYVGDELEEHRCHIRPLKFRFVPNTDKLNYYSYDIESTMSADNKHEISVIIICKLYTMEMTVFNSVIEFCRWIRSRTKKTYLFAHNGRSYDNYLIMSEIQKQETLKIGKVIQKGRKLLRMDIEKVIMTDSLNHFTGTLDSLVNAFGLSKKLTERGYKPRKTYFPYKFYKTENKNYTGIIPDREYFEQNNIKHSEKKGKHTDYIKDYEEFINWHDAKILETLETPYDINKECIEYCKQDCAILACALEVYRDRELSYSKLDPLQKITIASHAMAVFRTNYLTKNIVAVLSKKEYNFAKRAMKGGRTNSYVFYKKYPRIDYADINSMYPYILKTMAMPVGIPVIQVLQDNEYDFDTLHDLVNNSFGLIECDLIPPQNLKIAPLMVHDEEKNKLIESLDEMKKMVWTSVELQLAIKHGYLVSKIYEIHHYTQSTTLFRGYIKKYSDYKFDADERKDAIFEIPNYKNNPELMQELSELECTRAVAKAMLNNLWGKFGQNDDSVETKFFSKPGDWFNLVRREKSKQVDINTVEVLNNGQLFVQFKEINKDKLKLNNTNMTIAAFTTAYGRCMLYEEMYKIGFDRILYTDTDSIIYTYDEKGYNIKYGDELGEFKKENKVSITEFVSLGPKTYAYKYESEVGDIKCKGFDPEKYKLQGDKIEDKHITFNAYLHLINSAFDENGKLKNNNVDLKLPYQFMSFERKNNEIHTVDAVKILQFEYNKRQIVSIDETQPYGYNIN